MDSWRMALGPNDPTELTQWDKWRRSQCESECVGDNRHLIYADIPYLTELQKPSKADPKALF